MNEFELDLNVVRDLVLEIDTNIYHGADGATFTPSVSSAGVISWTNDKSLPNPDSVNIKGPQGEQGPAGQNGQNGATFTPSVSSAGVISWTNDKSLPNPDPVNIKGEKGDTGETGATGANGATFTPSVSSAGVISWTNDGGLPNPESVNIKGPQGEKGPAGVGVASGGTTGQILKKKSNTNFDTEWVDDGEGILYVTFTYKSSGRYTPSKSFAEIKAAWDSGLYVVGILGDNTFPIKSANASRIVLERLPDIDGVNAQFVQSYFIFQDNVADALYYNVANKYAKKTTPEIVMRYIDGEWIGYLNNGEIADYFYSEETANISLSILEFDQDNYPHFEVFAPVKKWWKYEEAKPDYYTSTGHLIVENNVLTTNNGVTTLTATQFEFIFDMDGYEMLSFTQIGQVVLS